jgi:hypothetical protein
MRTVVFGAVAAVGLSLLVVGVSEVAGVGASPAVVGAGMDLITLATPVGDQRQQLTLIDARTRVIGVYHVDNATGEIALKSVRNFSSDLQMSEFNTANPLPHEVRSILEQR